MPAVTCRYLCNDILAESKLASGHVCKWREGAESKLASGHVCKWREARRGRE